MAAIADPNKPVAVRVHDECNGSNVFGSDICTYRFYYADVMVTCDQRDQETPAYKRFPCLIVEVLSNSTEAFDRGDKFADYQTPESLQEYVLINTKRQRVECFRHNEQRLWVLQSYTAEDKSFRLNSVDFEEIIAALYEDVVFE